VTRPILALIALLAAVALGACGGGDDGSTGAASSASGPAQGATTAPAGGSLPAGCAKVDPPKPRASPNVPRPKAPAPRGSSVEMQTSCGTFTIRLAVSRAPRTAASFAGLVRRGFYDGLPFHRIAGDPASGPFVIQGGDPLGSGLGGPGFSVVEPPPASLRYTKYTVAMAKTATEPAGASGSQFFVVTAADAGLPPEYALVGRVTDGKDVVDRIASAPTDDQERPVAPIVIQKATLKTSS
jgi:peptidyl-prolyl cis-trans isomerase B (cyclophilin B)